MVATMLDLVEATAESGEHLSARFAPPHDNAYGLIPAADENELRRPLQAMTAPAVYPVWRIGGRDLSRPIVVRIDGEGGEFVVSNPKLRVWGAGATRHEALHDFAQTFITLVESYTNTADAELTDRAAEYRTLLRSYFP